MSRINSYLNPEKAALGNKPVLSFENIEQQYLKTVSDYERLVGVIPTLEAFTHIAETAESNGTSIEKNTLFAFKTALESFEDVIGNELQLKVSNEAISAEDFKKYIAQLVKAAKYAIRVIMDQLGELWAHMTNGVERSRKRVDATLERINKMKDQSNREAITVKSPAALMIEGEFVGNNPTNISDIAVVAEYVYVSHTDAAVNITKGVGNVYRSMELGPLSTYEQQANLHAELLTKASKTIVDNIKRIPNAQELRHGELQTRYKHIPKLVRGDILPGNYTLVQGFRNVSPVSLKMHGPNVESVLMPMLWNRIFILDFTKLDKKDGERNISYDLPPLDVLKKTGTELKSLLSIMSKAKEARVKFQKARKEIEDSIDAVFNQTTALNGKLAAIGTYNGKAHVNSLIMSMQNLLKTLQGPSGAFTGYVVRTVNSYNALLEHNLAYHERQQPKEENKA